MSKARPFIFALHNHQPVGNFDHVFEESFDRCYRPVLEVIGRYQTIKVALHFTGSLLEWIAKEHRDYLDDLRRLVDQGQVEILGGGFYEPILSILPDHDATGQIEMMAMFCDRYFGGRPNGMWLAERVWDPDLPRVLSPCEVQYTLLDDSHFRGSGISADVITGHYLTEKAGLPLAVFPIDKGLRYRIPFAKPEEVIDYIVGAPGDGCVTYGDDGEKFGVWPETYNWVFEQKWLENFFEALAAAQEENRIRTVHPTAYLQETPPQGRVYLPNASYEEMMEWALPVVGIRHLLDLKNKLKTAGEYEKFVPYIRGGIWQGFLAKYPEANQIHKKMLYISNRLQIAMEEAIAAEGSETITGDMGDRLGTAQRELYRGQCSCAYWHGLFGGLYLNYLRAALFRALLSTEVILDKLQQGSEDWISYEEQDFDLDGEDEILMANRFLNTYVRPHCGGTIFELDYKTKTFNITDVLTRREEGYHDIVRKASHYAYDDDPPNIHERLKEEGLEAMLVYDDVQRNTLVDRFLPPDATLDSVRGVHKDVGDFAGAVYQVESITVDEMEETSCCLELTRLGNVRTAEGSYAVRVAKQIQLSIDCAAIDVSYTITNESDTPLQLVFGTELNLTLLAEDDPSRYVLINDEEEHHLMGSDGITEGFTSALLVDRFDGFQVRISTKDRGMLFRYPVETVSQSEGGMERTYQGTCFLPVWHLDLAPGNSERILFSIAFEELEEPS